MNRAEPMSMAPQKKRRGPKPLTIEDMQAIGVARGGRCLSMMHALAHAQGGE